MRNGVASIGPVIASMKQAYENAIIEYSGPFGSGIVTTLEETIGPQIEGLEAVQNSINAAITAEQSVASGISQLLSVFVTLNSDYVLAIGSVVNASDDTFASALLAFDVPNAQTYWQQAAEAAQSSGL